MTQKVPTRVTLTDTSTKFGLVTIRTRAGGFVRAYKISAVEANLITAGVRRVPSGCTPEWWETGQSLMQTFCTLPGQAAILDDGTLLVCCAAEWKQGDFVQTHLKLQPSEFEVVDGVLNVIPTLKTQIEAGV